MTTKIVETQPPKMVTITEAEYYNLIEKDVLLSCLENQGVDNWDGYDEAIKEYRRWLVAEQE